MRYMTYHRFTLSAEKMLCLKWVGTLRERRLVKGLPGPACRASRLAGRRLPKHAFAAVELGGSFLVPPNGTA